MISLIENTFKMNKDFLSYFQWINYNEYIQINLTISIIINCYKFDFSYWPSRGFSLEGRKEQTYKLQ